MNKLKDLISNHFNEVSKRDVNSNLNLFGAKSNHFLLRDPYNYIENLIIDYKKNYSNILDYCCGTGIFSIFPAVYEYQVFGMDISDDSIHSANQRAKKHNVEDYCCFKTMDAEKLEYDDNFFDLILAYNSLSYLDLNKSYAELYRVIKPEGKIIIMDSLGNNPFFQFNRNMNLKKWAPKNIKNFSILKRKDLENNSEYFRLEKIKYFNFLSVFFFYISKRMNIKLNSHTIRDIDSLIMRLPFSYFLAFKYVAIYSPKKNL